MDSSTLYGSIWEEVWYLLFLQIHVALKPGDSLNLMDRDLELQFDKGFNNLLLFGHRVSSVWVESLQSLTILCSCSITEETFPWGKMKFEQIHFEEFWAYLTIRAAKQPDEQRKRFWSNIAVISNPNYRSTSQRNWDRTPKLYLSVSVGHSWSFI